MISASRPAATLPVDLDDIKENFEELFLRVWNREAEDDGFNRLVIAAGLGWRQVVTLRAYCKYLRQVGIPFSQAYMEDTLAGKSGDHADDRRSVRNSIRSPA